MILTIENILFVGSVLLLLSVLAGITSYRFGVPTLILFLLVGMFAGSEGLGKINFDNPRLAQFIGIVSLNFILFSGGLDTSWTTIRPVLKKGLLLSTLGVILTALSLGMFVWWVTDFSIYESMLLGSIVSSTDAAAVFSILRAKNLGLKQYLRPVLELESGSNDPVAYVLMIGFLGLVANQEMSFLSLFPLLISQMIIGAAGGYLFGRLSVYIINNIKLDFEGLYIVLVISWMFITFSFTDFLGGNGFLAIYLCAVYLGNHDIIHKKSIIRMYDGLAWLMQIVLFLTLGLQVFPSNLIPVWTTGLMISLFLIFIARPVAVFLSLSRLKVRNRSKMFLSWVGLRGAVPIVFATYPLLAGIDKAEMIFNIVFFISVSSVLIQGTTIGMVARWLHVVLPENVKPAKSPDLHLENNPRSMRSEITIPDSSVWNGKKILDMHLPSQVLVVLITRGNIYTVPTGSTTIHSGDVLTLIYDNHNDLLMARNILELT